MASPRLWHSLEVEGDAIRGPSSMTDREAEDLLDGLPLVPASAGSIQEMKALRDRCLAADIAALVGCPSGASKG